MKYDIPAYAEEIPQQKIYPVINFRKNLKICVHLRKQLDR